MIKAKGLTKIYYTGDSSLKALHDVTLEVKKGEFLAVVGRSGSGKSTLLYQLGLLDKPTEGSIQIDGVNVSSLDHNERTRFRLNELGYVFQDYALIPELTALENVAIPLLMQGKGKREAWNQAIAVLERIGLGDKINNLPSQLSGGQQQRVSIGRAISHNPKILFADEPTANLDSETSLVVLQVFKELHRGGQTIVMVTHEKEYATFAERIITLSDGGIVSDVPAVKNSKQ